jgi:hypothetical protein
VAVTGPLVDVLPNATSPALEPAHTSITPTLRSQSCCSARTPGSRDLDSLPHAYRVSKLITIAPRRSLPGGGGGSGRVGTGLHP